MKLSNYFWALFLMFGLNTNAIAGNNPPPANCPLDIIINEQSKNTCYINLYLCLNNSPLQCGTDYDYHIQACNDTFNYCYDDYLTENSNLLAICDDAHGGGQDNTESTVGIGDWHIDGPGCLDTTTGPDGADSRN